MPSNLLILCHPLLVPPSIFPSIRIFSNESVLHIRWPKDWSFSFSISPSNEYSGLISFRIDWLDLLAVQGTLKSLLQHHSSKASILRLSAFFIIQLSHPYVTTGKTIALIDGPLVAKSCLCSTHLNTNVHLSPACREKTTTGLIKFFSALGPMSLCNQLLFMFVMYGCESWTIKRAEH